MIGNIGMGELLLIFLVILLVFGAKRIPEIARGMGKGIREFKDATKDIKRELTLEDNNYYRVQSPQQGATMPRTDAYVAPEQKASEPAPTPPASDVNESQRYPA